MSFRDDWLQEWTAKAAVIRPRLETFPEAAREQFAVFEEIATRLAQAIVVRLRGDQAQVFLDTPRVEGQDYATWLRLPFPSLFVALESPLHFRGYLADADGEEMQIATVRHSVVEQLAQTSPQEIAQWLSDAERLRRRAQRLSPELGREAERAAIEMHVSGAALSESRARLVAMTQIAGMLEESTYATSTDPAVKGVLLFEDAFAEPTPVREATYRDGVATEELVTFSAIRRLGVVFFLPHPEDPLTLHSANLMIGHDGLHHSQVGYWKTRQRMLDWAIHLVNFLSSPSVKLVHVDPPPKLQKRRTRDGKVPLLGYYEITYAKHVQDYGGDKIAAGKAWEHSYRYDVRGHFKRFERGRMAGRVLWCPPHQRGLRHALYRPKGYVTEPAR